MNQAQLIDFKDNNKEEEALSYYKEVIKEFNNLPPTTRKDNAKEKLVLKYPWVVDYFSAAMDTRHPLNAQGCAFIGQMGIISRQSVSKTNQNGANKLDYVGKGPSPVKSVASWFEVNDSLKSTREELAHFSGYTHGAFDYAIEKLKKEGYEFETDKYGVIRVTDRPNNRKEEIKQEMVILLKKFEELKAELSKTK